ncbi:MAG: 50S ribosomal protein L10, partial [Planctomycetaceae bacterium]
MSKKLKSMLVEDLRSRIGSTRDFLVVDSSALAGSVANGLRVKLLKQDIRMLGVKNTLAQKVLDELGLGGVGTYLTGPSTLVFGGSDVVALSKEIARTAKDAGKLKIKGGIVEGKAIDAAGVDALSKSPSREELLSKIVSLALAPGANLAALLGAPGGVIA